MEGAKARPDETYKQLFANSTDSGELPSAAPPEPLEIRSPPVGLIIR